MRLIMSLHGGKRNPLQHVVAGNREQMEIEQFPGETDQAEKGPFRSVRNGPFHKEREREILLPVNYIGN